MMRKFRWALLWIGLGAVLLLFSVALAQDTTIDTIYGLITVDQAEVRVGPDFAYNAIGRLVRDTSVVIIGRSGDFFNRWDGRQWLKIQFGDSDAWLYARLARTSVAFNSIPLAGSRLLPRDRNGRVPEGFDLSSEICTQWQGGFTQSGDFNSGDRITVTYPGLQGANVYSVIAISPTGNRTPFDSETTEAVILLEDLPWEGGTYTWRVAPYWTDSPRRYNWQQVCLLQTGGTFEKAYTGPYTPTPPPPG
ncbi:MAG: hypothetical protein H6671_07395 [Anaerolineaceae bacterium]|nr:hypothetical protein [Anaerolineaceae bacterium]